MRRSRDFLRAWVRQYARGFFREDDAELQRAVASKAQHTEQVRRHCVELARHLRLPERDALCAELAGILHDLGRFRQFERYRTFNDGHSLDHAALALRIIGEKRLLLKIPALDRQRVAFAIARHNQRTIGDSIDGDALTCARILRDADKLDIYRVLEPFLTPAQNNVSEGFLARFVAGEQVDYNCVRSVDDLKLVRLMWLYDVNYTWTLRQIVARGYIEKIARCIPATPEIEAGVRRLAEYVNQRLEGDTEHGNR